MKNRSSNMIKLIAIILLVGISVLIMVKIPHEEVRKLVDSSGYYAPLVYVTLFAILPIGFFPVPVLALVGGISFGVIKGTIYTLLGAMINSIIMFYMARFIGRDYINSQLKKHLSEKTVSRIHSGKEMDLCLYLFIARLIPLIPYNLINYGFGLTDISILGYSITTLIGIIPGTIMFLNLGEKSTNVYSYEFIMAILMVVILIVVSVGLSKVLKKRGY